MQTAKQRADALAGQIASDYHTIWADLPLDVRIRAAEVRLIKSDPDREAILALIRVEEN